MAVNGKKGHGRIGLIKGRRQVYNPKNETWTEVDTLTNLFINQNSKKKHPFKDVIKHK